MNPLKADTMVNPVVFIVGQKFNRWNWTTNERNRLRISRNFLNASEKKQRWSRSVKIYTWFFSKISKRAAFLHQGGTNCGFRKLVRYRDNLCNIYYFLILFYICIFLFYHSNLYCITFKFPPTKENPRLCSQHLNHVVFQTLFISKL